MLTRGQQEKLDYTNFYTAMVYTFEDRTNRRNPVLGDGYLTMLYKDPIGRWLDVFHGCRPISNPLEGQKENATGERRGTMPLYDRVIDPDTLVQIQDKIQFEEALGVFGRLRFNIPKEKGR